MKLKLFYILSLTIILCSCKGNSNTKNGDGTNGTLKAKIFNPKDDLVGEFTTKPNGKAELKITKNKGNYFAQIIERGNWSEPEQLENIKNSDFQELFGKNWKEYVEAGLYKDSFGIFKVKKGYKSKDHTFKTGYFMFFLITSGDIYKLD